MRTPSELQEQHHQNPTRLFVAVPIERHFRNVFARYRDTHGKIPYLRWTAGKKLHITLLFIGPVTREELTSLHDSLGEVACSHEPFSLLLQKVTYAPPDRPADMVWAYFEPSVELDALAHDIHARCTDLGIHPADTFKNGRDALLPHVTLARFKERVEVNRLDDLRRTELEGYRLLVEDILLISSRSTPHGSVYSTLESYALNKD